MNVLRHGEADRSLLRWGGLAGILGGVLFLVFVFVGAVVGPDPAGPEGPVTRFPEIRAARPLENSLYLAVMALWAIHFLALYRALRGPSLASALSGSVLGIAGLTILAAGALPHVATSRLSALYHAPGATPRDQATVVLLWQANQGEGDAEPVDLALGEPPWLCFRRPKRNERFSERTSRVKSFGATWRRWPWNSTTTGS